MIVENGKMPNGLDDIARYLDLDPSKTVVLYSTSFGDDTDDGKKRKSINKGRLIYSEIMTYSSCNDNGVKSVVCYVDDDMLNYYDEVGIIKKENIIRVNDGNKVEYPYNSSSYMFNKRLKEDENLRKQLDGYTIYSPYISEWDVESKDLIHGKLLMDKDEQVKFNSKYFLREMSEKYNFSMPYGSNFIGLNNLDEVINKFRNDYKDEQTGCWIKLESQISGTGNINFLLSDDISDIKNKVLEVAKKLFDDEYILKELPLSFEIDMSSLKDEELVCNIGVEAVLGNDRVTILGGVAQSTKNGAYLGSIYCEETNQFIVEAKNAAKDAFVAYDTEGYRGFITCDVLVTRNRINNKLKGYVIDPNARFSAGTMLLKAIHKAEAFTNKQTFGSMFTNMIKLTDKSMDNYKLCAEPNLYKGKDSNYIGIYPVLMNNVSEFDEGKAVVQTVTLAHTYSDVERNYNEFKKKVKNL